MPRFALKTSSRCSSMQGIYAPLTGGSKSSSGCNGIQGIYDRLTRGFHLPAIYIYICSVAVYKASMLN